MTGMLASVENLTEARLALAAGADIIDLKAPAFGALGALPTASVAAIVAELGGCRPISATIGDLPMEATSVSNAVEAMAATGVDYVKIGCFPGGDWPGTLEALTPIAARGIRLVAVLFGDHTPPLHWVDALAVAGFAGAMLDTQDKRLGPLPRLCSPDYLGAFVGAVKARGMLCGLAGSLRQADIAPLLELQPDYLGFRGALCRQQERTANLDENAVRNVRALVYGGVRHKNVPDDADAA